MSVNDSFKVEVWSGDWELPSVDVQCLQILTYAKFTNASLSVKANNNPFLKPDGRLPVLKFQSNTFCTASKILDILCEHTASQDIISSLQNAETIAFNSLLEECLYPALQYLWWIDQRNFNDIIRPWYSKAIPFPINMYYCGKYQKDAKLLFEILYPTEEIEEIEDLVYSKAKSCITTLSTKLGESDYFFGSVPSKLDALIFAYLAPILKIPLPNSVLQSHLKTFDNLVNFITRILNLNFKKELENQKLKTKKVKSSTVKQMETATKHQIFAGIFATVAMLGYALSTGIMQRPDNDYNSIDDQYIYDNSDYGE